MDKENNWSDINEDVTDIAKKVKSKIDEEDLVEDLKDSFKKTVESATDIFKTLINTLDSTITDEEIRQDSKKVVDPRSETSFRGKSYLAVGNKQAVKGSGAARKQKDVTWV
mgnify:CR=1 FL=1